MDLVISKTRKMKFHTNLRVVFEAFEGKQRDYNWLLTNIELNRYPEKFLQEEKLFLSGDELTEIVTKYDIQFIWCVLTGFSKDITVNVNKLEVEPFADDNPGYWNDNPQVQHPQGTVELVCWDSSLTILITKDLNLGKKFKRYFPEAESLSDYKKRFL